MVMFRYGRPSHNCAEVQSVRICSATSVATSPASAGAPAPGADLSARELFEQAVGGQRVDHG